MPNLTIGTAGHVDHGKSALVEALTGTHPDRLIEEQERGMTIDLGFAFMKLSDGSEAPIIDVPGHERFLKTMVAGVSGIHLVLFVVAADEGIMPQTVEHLGTVRMMGVEHGIIVVTKRDLVEEDWLMLVEEEISDLVSGTFLETAPVHRVSSITGEGIPELRAGIEQALSHIAPGRDNGVFRLPIDRVFTLKGFGTIVAGTVLSGSVSAEDPLELLPTRIPVRLRGLQTHNQKIEQAAAGQRAALNLASVKVQEVERGHELSVPGYLLPTMMLDARLQTLESLDEPVMNRTRIRLHKGTAETIGRVMLLDKEMLEPGESGYVQFRLESPVVAERNERFIIRGFSSMRLLGGGQILDVYPQKHRRFRPTVLAHLQAITEASPAMLVEQVLRDAYGAQRVKSIPDMVRVTNLTVDTVSGLVDQRVSDGTFFRFPDGTVIHWFWYERLHTEILEQLGQLHLSQRLRETLPRDSVRARLSSPVSDAVYDVIMKTLIQDWKIELLEGEIRLPGHAVVLTPQEQAILDVINRTAIGNGITISTLSDLQHSVPDEKPELVKGMISYLLGRGVLVEFAERLVIHRDTLADAERRLVNYLTAHETVRAAEFRDHLGISRSHATALLDYFCDRGVTNREAGTHRLAEGG